MRMGRFGSGASLQKDRALLRVLCGQREAEDMRAHGEIRRGRKPGPRGGRGLSGACGWDPLGPSQPKGSHPVPGKEGASTEAGWNPVTLFLRLGTLPPRKAVRGAGQPWAVSGPWPQSRKREVDTGCIQVHSVSPHPLPWNLGHGGSRADSLTGELSLLLFHELAGVSSVSGLQMVLKLLIKTVKLGSSLAGMNS